MIDAFNRSDLAGMNSYWAQDLVHHSRGRSVTTADATAAMASVRAAFPDLRITVETLVAEGDKVAALLTLSGTHSGEFLGIPPTDKAVSVALQSVVRIRDGKVTEHWGVADGLAMLDQLGLIPREFLSATA
jgi:C-1 hydroxylase